MDILIVAIETGRWGPARLPRALKDAGLTVAALCPADNAVAATDFLDRHYDLPVTRSGRRLAAALADAMQDCRPRLIVPADEQVVALLHALVRRGPGRLNAAALAAIAASLGEPAHFDAMLMKGETLALARTLGVRVPPGGSVASLAEASAMAERIGYPVYVKAPFGWAGQGVTRCEDAIALAGALPPRPGALAPLKTLVRRVLGRDWFPTPAYVDVQSAIDGRPAMYCAVAWQGKMLAGFGGIPRETVSATGPSSVLWIGPHPAMAAAAERMIAALGASGFIGFDFMLAHGTDDAYLLECNPRPIQVCHLGARIGADLMRPLADALAGRAVATDAATPDHALEVALFPYAGQRSDFDPATVLDVPWDDAGLCRYAGLDPVSPGLAVGCILPIG